MKNKKQVKEMDWLKEGYKNHPEKLCMNRHTYEDVYYKTLSLARKLWGILKDEKRTAIYSFNSEEMALYILALFYLKKEILLLNAHLTKEEVEKQAEACDIHVLFSDRAEELDSIKVITFEEGERLGESPISFSSWNAADDETAVILNTSATTGKFKSVPIRWRQIRAHVEASAEILGVKSLDNWLITLPLFHVSGLTVLLRSLYNKTAVTILPKFNEEEVLTLIREGRINMISLVPTMLQRIYQRIGKNRLRVILLGGEFIPDTLVKNCVEKKLPIYKTYGMTETLSQSTTFSVLQYPEKVKSVGKPLPGVTIEIKNKISDGAGEIWIKSPMLMEGYLGENRRIESFNTDDIGYLDKEGFLYLLNRRTDIIISGGENIYPKEMEDLLYQLSEIKECAVIGESDPKWGQRPVLYLVSEMAEEKIQSYLSAHLAGYKIPQKIIYRKELPKNASGKIERTLLRGEKKE